MAQTLVYASMHRSIESSYCKPLKKQLAMHMVTFFGIAPAMLNNLRQVTQRPGGEGGGGEEKGARKEQGVTQETQICELHCFVEAEDARSDQKVF